MEILRQSLALGTVFALLWMALRLLRQRGWAKMQGWPGNRRKPGPGLLESRGKLTLTARHSIHLVRIGDRNLIVALHPDGLTFLGDAPLAADCDRPELAAR